MAGTKNRRATYDDLLALPEHVVGELIDGELIVSPRPALPHALASSAIGGELHGPFNRPPGGGTGGWWILDEPELHFGADVLVPDLAGWRRERMPTLPNLPALELPPDWVCEVISPSTARLDRTRTMRPYARVEVGRVDRAEDALVFHGQRDRRLAVGQLGRHRLGGQRQRQARDRLAADQAAGLVLLRFEQETTLRAAAQHAPSAPLARRCGHWRLGSLIWFSSGAG
jgi:Uma2 family endonuclease